MEIQKKMTKLTKIMEHIKHTFYQSYRTEEDSEKVNISLLLSHFLLPYLMSVWIFKRNLYDGKHFIASIC